MRKKSKHKTNERMTDSPVKDENASANSEIDIQVMLAFHNNIVGAIRLIFIGVFAVVAMSSISLATCDGAKFIKHVPMLMPVLFEFMYYGCGMLVIYCLFICSFRFVCKKFKKSNLYKEFTVLNVVITVATVVFIAITAFTFFPRVNFIIASIPK